MQIAIELNNIINNLSNNEEGSNNLNLSDDNWTNFQIDILKNKEEKWTKKLEDYGKLDAE